MRSRKAPATFFIVGIAIIAAALLAWPAISSAAGDAYAALTGQGCVRLTIAGALVHNGQVVQEWDAPSALAIMFGNTRVDGVDGEYELHFTPVWDIRVANVSEDQYTVKVMVTSVSQAWKGKALQDVVPFGVSNTNQTTKPSSDLSTRLSCAKRIFGCNTVVGDPPPAGQSADYTITYSWKVELYSGSTLVDTKTGTTTAKATFTNTISGALSSISVTVSPVQVFMPWPEPGF
ncbi:MAG: hypothetical protein ACQXXL_03475 [Candidatus Methanosuratincola sp.]|jgi:hypothetical protein